MSDLVRWDIKSLFLFIVLILFGILLTNNHQSLLLKRELVEVASIEIPPGLRLVRTTTFIQPRDHQTYLKISPIDFLREIRGIAYYRPVFTETAFYGSHIYLANIQNDKVTSSELTIGGGDIANVVVDKNYLRIYRNKFYYDKYLFWSWLAAFSCFVLVAFFLHKSFPKDWFNGLVCGDM